MPLLVAVDKPAVMMMSPPLNVVPEPMDNNMSPPLPCVALPVNKLKCPDVPLLVVPDRIYVTRSGIHGWGVFARRDIMMDEIIAEYVGEAVRSIVADRRENEYDRQHSQGGLMGGCPNKYQHAIPSTTIAPRVHQLLEGTVVASGFEIQLPAGNLAGMSMIVMSTQPSSCAVTITANTRVVVTIK